MPKMKFSKTEIDKLKKSGSGQVIYWDTDTPGLGLVVGTRTMTFRLQIDVKDASKPKGYKTIKKTLGRYGDITLEDAKKLMRGYVDKETGEAVLGERIRLKMGDTAKVGDRVTLQELIVFYFKETKRRDGKERRESAVVNYRYQIEKQYAGWLHLSLKEVNALTPDVVLDKFQQIAANSSMNARNASVMLSAVLNYGLAKYPGTLKSNPLAILTSRHVNVMEKIKARHECLIYDADKKRNDFKVFYDGIQVMNEIRTDLALFILYTGMRKTEGAALEWQHIDMEHKELHLKDTKNREDLNIPLSRQAMAILERRKAKVPDGCKWVFPAIGHKSKIGHATIRPEVIQQITGLDMTVHGMRRTFITVGRKLKRYEDTDRLTNHVDSSMSGKHYDETDIEDLRETCQMIGNEIERRMLAENAKVINISTGRQAA